MPKTADLLEEIAALKALLIAADARDKRKDERIARLEKLVAAFRQAVFGRKSEKSDPDQFELALEDLETAMAVIHAEEDAEDRAAKRPAKPRVANRGALPKHLPRIEEIIEPDSLICACGGCLHCIGEDVSERLDIVPAQFRVIVTRRPKYACRSCTDGVAQAAAPARLIPGGMPTEATVAHVLVSKYADHLPLYRQAQIYSRQGVDLDRSTLADWVGRAAFELRPVHDALMADLKRSTKLFMDETRAPVLDPGARKTKTGYFWALARDDRPWGGTSPPGVVFTFAPGRGGQHAERILQGFGGILQVDGYAGYNRLIAADRIGPGIQLAYCWAHARRKLIEITRTGPAPIAEEAWPSSAISTPSRPRSAAATPRPDCLSGRTAPPQSWAASTTGWSTTAPAPRPSHPWAKRSPTSPNTATALAASSTMAASRSTTTPSNAPSAPSP